MYSELSQSSDKKVRGRVLFTGNGIFVIDDLIRHLPTVYHAEKTTAAERPFLEALRVFSPHALVICLADESRETLRMLSALMDAPDYAHLPIIAIGNDADCETFKRNIFQKPMQVFTRPLDSTLFEERLSEFVNFGISDEEQRKSEKEKEKAPEKSEAGGEAQADADGDLMNIDANLLKKVERMNRLYGRKMILVVDDDTRMLNVIKLYLQDLYDVTLVPSGKLALKFLAKKHADLVLLDYIMPQEDGPTVLRQIRQETPQKDVPVLFLTGVADKGLVMRGLEFHPKGYMLKPVTRSALLEKVTEILLDI